MCCQNRYYSRKHLLMIPHSVCVIIYKHAFKFVFGYLFHFVLHAYQLVLRSYLPELWHTSSVHSYVPPANRFFSSACLLLLKLCICVGFFMDFFFFILYTHSLVLGAENLPESHASLVNPVCYDDIDGYLERNALLSYLTHVEFICNFHL